MGSHPPEMAINARMHPKTLFLLATLLVLPNLADASWWWPFGKSYHELPAIEQTERARPVYEAAVEARAKGRNRKAARLFRTVWKDYPGATFTPDALYQHGAIKFEQQDWRRSFDSFSQLLRRHPDFPHFNEVVHYIFQIGLANARGENIRWAYVVPYRAYDRAVLYFENLLNLAPYSDLAPLALMNIALIHQYQDNIPEAIDALDRMINNYPSSLLADDAYLALGHTFADLTDGPLYDQGATREAMSYYEDFLVLFPRHPEVGEGEEGLVAMRNQYAESKLVIGKYYYIHRNWYLASEIFFNEAITIAPDSPAAGEARRYIAQIERFKQAAAEDPSFVPPATTWADRLLFWRSRSTDLTPEAAAEASAEADEEASPASGPEAADLDG